MDRRDRGYFDRNDYEQQHGRYEDYGRQDAGYHGGRNVTDRFEQDYQRDRGRWDQDRNRYNPPRSYHEGNSMGDTYERLSRERGAVRSDTSFDLISRGHDREFFGNQDRDHDRYSNRRALRNYQGMDSGDQERDRGDWHRDRGLRGNIRQGYGISSFEGTSDRYNTLESEHNRGGAGDNQAYYGGMRGGYSNSGFGSGMGESFPGSFRGVPDATYGLGNFADNYGTGMGSSYGGKNYSGGTGYMGGHRGGSFGRQSYGTSSGNYGGDGAMGSGTYGGRGGTGGDTSHNSNRGTSESGGF